jgi:biopolymer transport protein ExbD
VAIKFKSKARECRLDMTSMIDITFLLIAFFTVLINFSDAEQNDRVHLPISELAKPPDAPPTAPITLHVLENGNVIYGTQEYTPDGLVKQIEFHLRFLKAMKTPLKTVTVIIRADGSCPAGKVQDVIELCQKLKLENFKLRAKQNDQ